MAATPATLFAANESSVMIGPDAVGGVRAVEYRYQQVRQNVYALGSPVRVGVISGAQTVEGRIRVASASDVLDSKLGDTPFDLTLDLHHGETAKSITFTGCLITEKSFDMSVGGHGETVYAFSGTSLQA